jgi:hypothetical protein
MVPPRPAFEPLKKRKIVPLPLLPELLGILLHICVGFRPRLRMRRILDHELPCPSAAAQEERADGRFVLGGVDAARLGDGRIISHRGQRMVGACCIPGVVEVGLDPDSFEGGTVPPMECVAAQAPRQRCKSSQDRSYQNYL